MSLPILERVGVEESSSPRIAQERGQTYESLQLPKPEWMIAGRYQSLLDPKQVEHRQTIHLLFSNFTYLQLVLLSETSVVAALTTPSVAFALRCTSPAVVSTSSTASATAGSCSELSKGSPWLSWLRAILAHVPRLLAVEADARCTFSSTATSTASEATSTSEASRSRTTLVVVSD